MNFYPLLSIILTLFILMLCGFACRKLGIINNASSKGLSKLIISIGQPAMIIAALANAEYICYASPNTSVVNNENYSLKDEKILYPDEDEYPKCQYFHDLPAEIRSYYESLWEEILR